MTADECLANVAEVAGRRVRVSGRVVPKTLCMAADRLGATFSLAGSTGRLQVVCSGALPDNLASAADVVVEGRIDAMGLLRGDKVLTRCASKYQSQVGADASPVLSGNTGETPVPPRRRRSGPSRFRRAKPGAISGVEGELMTSLGQFCLLAAMVASGYSAFACAAGGLRRHRGVSRSGVWAGVAAAAALTAATAVLAWALVQKDFRFQYVLQYSDSLLPWQYSLSAFWVGQGGSLLLWAWMVALLRWPISSPPNASPPDSASWSSGC